jgi:hypothetical protein
MTILTLVLDQSLCEALNRAPESGRCLIGWKEAIDNVEQSEQRPALSTRPPCDVAATCALKPKMKEESGVFILEKVDVSNRLINTHLPVGSGL